MPISDFASYVQVMDEIALHWALVDAELGGTPLTALKLQGLFGLIEFVAAKDALDAFLIGFEDLENAREIGAGTRDNLKGTVRQKFGQFRGMLRAVLPNSKYAAAAPNLPNFGADESKFLAPIDDAASLWLRINADTTIPGFTPPLVIAGMTQAMFAAEITAIRAAYHAIRVADTNLNVARKERQTLLNAAFERMVQYRAAVEGLFGTDHPLTQSLPALSSAPGSTPDESDLSGNWNPATDQADFTWTPSSNPNLDHYQMRMSSGSSYDAATATVIGNFPPGTTSFSTTDGLANPGDVASYKLFVILTTGNEAGSNTVTITRP
ncbi:MAG: hypothetical protein AABP62_02960 [Planctomycetota bacterium]